MTLLSLSVPFPRPAPTKKEGTFGSRSLGGKFVISGHREPPACLSLSSSPTVPGDDDDTLDAYPEAIKTGGQEQDVESIKWMS